MKNEVFGRRNHLFTSCPKFAIIAIKAVWISNNGVLYQVVYMNQGKLEDPYVMREMFEVVDQEPVPAGFRLNEPK